MKQGDSKMKKSQLILALSALFTLTTTYAVSHGVDALQDKREQVARRYIADLQAADYEDIASLFTKNGIVISTTRGEVNAKEFFYSFLPNIDSATTDLHQVFINTNDPGRFAARFHFTFKLKDGEQGNGEYVDEFVFADNSLQLKAVYMFENLKFSNINGFR